MRCHHFELTPADNTTSANYILLPIQIHFATGCQMFESITPILLFADRTTMQTEILKPYEHSRCALHKNAALTKLQNS